MNDEQLHTLAQMQAFLDGTVAVEFSVGWGATIILAGRTTTMMAGGSSSTAATPP